MKLSIVYCARDDGYGDDYNCSKLRTDPEFAKKFVLKYNSIQRIKFTLEKNIEILNKYFKNTFEIVFIDWSPKNEQYLYLNPELQNIFENDCIKNIIVPSNIIKKHNLNPKGFYEYFAKNIGIRHAKGEFILIGNPDGIITDELITNMKDAIENINYPFYGRCHSRMDCDHNLKHIEEGLSFPKNGIIFDEIMGTPAAGDFLLTKKDILTTMTGFEEFNCNGNQTMLDGKIVIKLYKNDIKPIKLNGSILHLDHNKHDRTGMPPNWRNDYKNDNNWGFNNRSLKKIKDNIYYLD